MEPIFLECKQLFLNFKIFLGMFWKAFYSGNSRIFRVKNE